MADKAIAVKTLSLLLLTVCWLRSYSQHVVILPGRVRCLNNGVVNSTRGAENLIVVPGFIPSRSTITSTDPTKGLFTINTAVKWSELRDKNVRVYILTNCGVFPYTFFVSNDNIDPNSPPEERNIVLRREEIKIKKDCSETELNLVRSEKMLDSLRKIEKKEVSKEGDVITASPSLLNFLFTIVALAPPPVDPDSIISKMRPIESISPTTMHNGYFLVGALCNMTSNLGFNLAPFRNMGEAVYWNPSALLTPNAMETKTIYGSSFTNLRNHLKFNLSYLFSKRFAVGLGVMLNGQSESRDIKLDSSQVNVKVSSKQYGVFGSLAYKIGKVSIGLSSKFIQQKFNNPSEFIQRLYYSDGRVYNTEEELIENNIREMAFDYDVSASYKVNRHFQVGLSLMNLRNTKLIDKTFLKSEDPQKVGLRMAAMGVTYSNKRLQIGNEIIRWQDRIIWNGGLNYVPFNKAEISVGYSTLNEGYNIGFKFGNFRIQYIDTKKVSSNYNMSNSGFRLAIKPVFFASVNFPFPQFVSKKTRLDQ